jgi:hypothetical protein
VRLPDERRLSYEHWMAGCPYLRGEPDGCFRPIAPACDRVNERRDG